MAAACGCPSRFTPSLLPVRPPATSLGRSLHQRNLLLANPMVIALNAFLESALFAVLGSGSWLVVSALFNQLVLMLPDFEQSQRGYIFALMNVAVQASKLPALVYASRKLMVRYQSMNYNVVIVFHTAIQTGPQALRLCCSIHRRHHCCSTRHFLERHCQY